MKPAQREVLGGKGVVRSARAPRAPTHRLTQFSLNADGAMNNPG